MKFKNSKAVEKTHAESNKIFGETAKKRHGYVPYAEKNRGLVLKLKMEQRCDLRSLSKFNGDKGFFGVKGIKNEDVKRMKPVFILG